MGKPECYEESPIQGMYIRIQTCPLLMECEIEFPMQRMTSRTPLNFICVYLVTISLCRILNTIAQVTIKYTIAKSIMFFM